MHVFTLFFNLLFIFLNFFQVLLRYEWQFNNYIHIRGWNVVFDKVRFVMITTMELINVSILT